MRLAHLILAHKNPGQVERLIRALEHEQFDFYIHLDAQADLAGFARLQALPRVRFVQPRHLVRWGSYSIVEATLQGMREILGSGISYDFINLLSGQDYPIQPADAIYRFFASQPGRSFFSVEAQGSAWWQHAISRVEQYHTVYYKFRLQYALERLLNRLLPRRRFPLSYQLYGGPYGTWWTMDRACATYLVRFMDEHAHVRRFSRFTWGSDEFLLSTILMNSPLRHNVVNDSYRYIDWSGGGASPKLLTLADFPALQASDRLFARKFDVAHDAAILDMIDQQLLHLKPASSC
ncbi:beta-1,6-N-acetylglucosaminyltransferase [Hymenobacter saemangeumensis]|uniref:Peptide O-xylosyltransferase n=1 Tax=Hymenobacter saemangeumensis TaxID=1084522 RepID=A0ABP8HX37_9BACT